MKSKNAKPRRKKGTEPATWNDAAAQFMETEPNELSSSSLREVLERIPAGIGDVSDTALKEAKARLDEMLSDAPLNREEAFQDLGKWIEVGVTGILPKVEAAPAVVQNLPEEADPELTVDFIVESREFLLAAEASLLELESDPENMEAIGRIFRAFHTIKGTSAYLNLTWIKDLAHRAEGLLSRVRDKQIRCLGGYANLALRSADMLVSLLGIAENALNTGEPMVQPEGYGLLLEVLENPEASGISEASDSTHSAAAPAAAAEPVSTPSMPAAPAQEAGVEEMLEAPEIVEEVSTVDEAGSDAAVAPRESDPPSVAAGAAEPPRQAPRAKSRPQGTESATDSSVRVRTDRLDRLIDMVGELVIAQSMITQDSTVMRGGHLDLIRKVSHSGKIVRELQDLSMSMRMVPLKPTFQKLNRLVRDLCQKNKKLVEFVTSGEDTEIDRNMVDVVGDPLVHMLRNAVDHGIEMPDVREAANKPATGTIRLSAYHAGGNVVLELSDDGQGLNREKILRKAIANGLVEPDKTLSDSEVFNLIFAPGFSTAEQVTEVSGRGVGMDVVKRNIDSLRGRVDIASQPGKGCTFTIRLPLTLAITDGMLVKVGTERYIIPTVNIYLSFRPQSAALSSIEGRGEMVMLRDELMPVFRLHRLFDVDGGIEDPTSALLVVVSDKKGKCALLVDELLGQQQVVAKSLGSEMRKIPGVSGGAILGDGKVGLILDPAELASAARGVNDRAAMN